jgi:hypothetical protein
MNSGRSGTLEAMGTGLITGAADDDPSAIGTYVHAVPVMTSGAADDLCQTAG